MHNPSREINRLLRKGIALPNVCAGVRVYYGDSSALLLIALLFSQSELLLPLFSLTWKFHVVDLFRGYIDTRNERRDPVYDRNRTNFHLLSLVACGSLRGRVI